MKMLMQEIRGTKLADRQIAIFWLGQNSFIFKTCRGTTIGLDLYLSRTRPREIHVHAEPPAKPWEVRADYVFCTHDHWDHTDPDTLPVIAESSLHTRFLGPEESYEHFLRMGIGRERAFLLEPGVTKHFGDFKVTPFFSIPPTEETTTHHGYLFEFGDLKIFNLGDSSASVTANPGPILDPVAEMCPEIAMFPIIGDYPGRRPGDAFKFAEIVKPKVVIPSHYECFKDRTIDPVEFIRLFKENSGIKPVVIKYAGRYVCSGSLL